MGGVLTSMKSLVLIAGLGLLLPVPADAGRPTFPVGCCVCTGCPDEAALSCVEIAFGCDDSDCEEACAGCQGVNFRDPQCAELAVCADAAPSPAASAPLAALVVFVLGIYFLRKRNMGTEARIVAVVLSLLTSTVVLYAATQFELSGTWNPGFGEAGTGGRGWTAELTRDGSELSGNIVVTGAKIVTVGSFSGTVEGREVTGAILDNDGEEVATVAGSVVGRVLNGEYTTNDGDSGTFTWDLP